MANERVLVVGSINMDVVARVDRLPRPGETVPGRDIAYLPGGKGANQAVAAARLGADVRMIGCVGDDSFGSELLRGLEHAGVDVHFVRRCTQTPSGAAMIFVETGGQNSIAVVAGANGLLIAADVESAEVWTDVRVVLLQLETPMETVEAAVVAARRLGITVILDPAPAPVVELPPLLFNVDVLSPNQSEAQALTGITVETIADAESAARDLRKRGARNVVVKLGELGAYWIGPDERGMHVTAPKIVATDATAAGDAFNGALGVAIAEGRSFADAIRFACSAGALACTTHGAQNSMPMRTEVEALTVQPVSARQ